MSQKNKRRKFAGFTMPEMLVGMIIFGFAVAGAVSTYSMLNQAWKEDLTLAELSHDANMAVERMIRGMPANTGLVAAQSVQLPVAGASGDSLNFTDMNGVARRFYYSGGAINTEGGDPILQNVDSVTFYNTNNLIRIVLGLHKFVVSKEIRFSMETQVAPRN